MIFSGTFRFLSAFQIEARFALSKTFSKSTNVLHKWQIVAAVLQRLLEKGTQRFYIVDAALIRSKTTQFLAN